MVGSPYELKKEMNVSSLAKTMKKDEADRALIRAAMTYRSGTDSINSVYMGSMATAGLYAILRLGYGSDGFEQKLNLATRAQLDQLLEKCDNIIKYMREHPTKKCPCCGQIVPAKKQRRS